MPASTLEVVRSKDWYDEQEILEQERERAGSEFGVTLADAGKLLRKAKRVWIMFPIAPDGRNAIFAVPKSVVTAEIKFYQGGKKTFRPSELDLTTHDGPTLIFGSREANSRAAASEQKGMAT